MSFTFDANTKLLWRLDEQLHGSDLSLASDATGNFTLSQATESKRPILQGGPGGAGYYSLWFDGSDDYMSASATDTVRDEIGFGSFTMSAWVNCNDLSAGNTVVALFGDNTMETGAENLLARLSLLAGGTISLSWEYFDGEDQQVDSDESADLAQWTHVAASVTGESVKYLDLGGTDEYVDMGDNLSFEWSDPKSFSLWIMSDVSGGFALSKSDDVPRGYGIIVGGGNVTYIESGIGGNMQVSLDGSHFDATTWAHIVVTDDGSGTPAGINMYVNGSPESTSTVSDALGGTISNVASFNIGSRNNGFHASSCCEAKIRHVAVYDKELSSAEAAEIYGGGTPPDLTSVGPTDNLLGWWKCGEGDVYPNIYDYGIGSTFPNVADLSPSGYHGVMVNMEIEDVFDDPPNHYSCIGFDSGSEYMTMGDVLGFDTGDTFSISLWIRTTVSYDFVLSKMVGSPTYAGYALRIVVSGGMQVMIRNDASTASIDIETTTQVRNGNWNHFVCTYDGSGVAAGIVCYVNGTPSGVVVNSDTLAGNTILNAAEFNISGRTNGGAGTALAGDVDDVSVWDKVLSQAEVTAIYNGGVPNDLTGSANLVGYWTFGEGVPADGEMKNMEATDLDQHALRTVRFFKNGAFTNESVETFGPSGGQNANWMFGSVNSTDVMFGGIAEVHVSNIARDDAYIAAEYAAGYAAQDANTIALWNFEGRPVEASEESPTYGAHLFGGNTIPEYPTIVHSIVDGLGRSRLFSTSNYLAAPTRLDLRSIFDPAETGDMTFEAWFRVHFGAAGLIELFGYSGVGETQDANILFQVLLDWNTKNLRVKWESGAGTDVVNDSTNPLWASSDEDHQVHYLAVTRHYNASSLLDIAIYVDGALVDDTITDVALPDGGALAFCELGRGGYCTFGDVRISDKLRTSQEILAAYTANVYKGARETLRRSAR